jgi:methyl-accepting chemotaxis protein
MALSKRYVIILVGGLTCACSSSLAVALASTLGWKDGGGVGVVVAAVLGLIGSWLVVEMADRLTLDSAENSNRPPAGSGSGELGRSASWADLTSGAVSGSSGPPSAAASTQIEGISQATTLVETLSAQVDRTAQHADAAAVSIGKVLQQSQMGQAKVQAALQSMKRLRVLVEANGRKIRRHSDRSVEIAAIVEMITGISQRTDILALNATIESVRAGEQSRGFGLVAEEIRKLAERTADATREIGALAEVIQAETIESMRGLEDQQDEVDQQVNRIREIGSELTQIGEATTSCAQFIDSALEETTEQARTTQELGALLRGIMTAAESSLEGMKRVRQQVISLARRFESLERGTLGDGSVPPRSAPAEPSRSLADAQPQLAPTEQANMLING